MKTATQNNHNFLFHLHLGQTLLSCLAPTDERTEFSSNNNKKELDNKPEVGYKRRIRYGRERVREILPAQT